MKERIDLDSLQSEGRNPRTLDIDVVDTAEVCRIINEEDSDVPRAVAKCLPAIANAIDALTERVRAGGRVIYTGAGTSGRLGVLDASELPPTFSADPNQFVAIIAGGDFALRNAVEGAEDDIEQAVSDLQSLALSEGDCLIGIAASGRTPYVLSGLSYAKTLGCLTIGVTCSSPSSMSRSGNVDCMIEAVAGPEVVSGSTRLKAGTATKLVLNMLSTGIHIRLGKTYSNLMVDVKSTNQKLRERARRIVRLCCGPICTLSDTELDKLLLQSDGSVKLAIAAIKLDVPICEAEARLGESGGVLAKVLRDRKQPGEIKKDSFLQNKFVLCIDGGGSKCAAFVLGSNGEAGSATAAACNVTTTYADVATALIARTAREAMEQCPSLRGHDVQTVPFAKVWIGLAGFDRPAVAAALAASLAALFRKVPSDDLVATNDLELLASSVGRDVDRKVCVLVAGTGSIAMSFEKGAHGYRQNGRAGGWGPLLGDDGSGFDIGRQAIRHLLEAQDRPCKTGSRNTAAVDDVEDGLDTAILQHLGLSRLSACVNETLAAILVPSLSNPKDSRQKIAEIAKVVLEQQGSSAAADAIVARSVSTLAELVERLTISSALDPSEAVIVLTGGMIQNWRFRSLLLRQISNRGLSFGRVEGVHQPGLLGAQHLLKTLE